MVNLPSAISLVTRTSTLERCALSSAQRDQCLVVDKKQSLNLECEAAIAQFQFSRRRNTFGSCASGFLCTSLRPSLWNRRCVEEKNVEIQVLENCLSACYALNHVFCAEPVGVSHALSRAVSFPDGCSYGVSGLPEAPNQDIQRKRKNEDRKHKQNEPEMPPKQKQNQRCEHVNNTRIPSTRLTQKKNSKRKPQRHAAKPTQDSDRKTQPHAKHKLDGEKRQALESGSFVHLPPRLFCCLTPLLQNSFQWSGFQIHGVLLSALHLHFLEGKRRTCVAMYRSPLQLVG